MTNQAITGPVEASGGIPRKWISVSERDLFLFVGVPGDDRLEWSFVAELKKYNPERCERPWVGYVLRGEWTGPLVLACHEKQRDDAASAIEQQVTEFLRTKGLR
jgi:hypothetical protein